MKIDLNNIYNLDCNEALEDIEKLDEANGGGVHRNRPAL